MNFELFDSFTKQQAEEHLREFLESESEAFDAMGPDLMRKGIVVNYSVHSVSAVLKTIIHELRMYRIPVPDTEPDWIRRAHDQGLIEFEEESKYLILRAGYYLGESFVRTFGGLKWSIGNPEFMTKSMPVVTGFDSNQEMAPVMIVENLALRIHGDGAAEHDIDRAIVHWSNPVS